MEQQHKILFTGLTGNLGRTLIPLLRKNNYIVYTTYKYQKELDFIGEKDSEFINPIKCDLLSEKDIAKMVTSFKIHFDSVVNLVGGFIYKDLISSDINDIKKMMDINLYSVFNICKYSPKILASSSNKSIINMLTPYAENPVAGVCTYSSSKAALLNLSKSMAIEFEKYSIRVNSIMTDTIDTQVNRQEMPNANFSKWIKPIQIFSAIEMLISKESKFINGEIIKLSNE